MISRCRALPSQFTNAQVMRCIYFDSTSEVPLLLILHLSASTLSRWPAGPISTMRHIPTYMMPMEASLPYAATRDLFD